MMKRLVLFLLTVFMWNLAVGQEDGGAVAGYVTPDYDQIKKDCNDKQSKHYYPRLAKRFAEMDTTLDLDDLQAFYYGQAFLDGYNPYRLYGQFEIIRNILNKEEEPTASDLAEIVRLADAVIAQYPAEPEAYYYKFVGQSLACEYFGGDTAEMQKTQLQFQMLFYTIASTGNGTTPEVAMHVVNTSHEYMMMSMYGFEMKQQALMNNDVHSYDMFVLDTNVYGVDTLYFNIDRIVGAWSSLFSDFDEEESEPVTSIDFELGVKFVLELKKPKRKESQFVLISKERVHDTLVCKRDSLFREPVPKGQIVGYFCPMRLSESSEKVWNCFVFISNCDKMLYYDAAIANDSHEYDFQPTTNEGMPNGVMMNEMWHCDVQNLRISNIRTKK